MICCQKKKKQIEAQKRKMQFKISSSYLCPNKYLSAHWLTIVRPQYDFTCGISSVVSIWNFQFSTLGIGNKEPISVEKALLMLNIIGEGSVGENTLSQQSKANSNDLGMRAYLKQVKFGSFSSNEALMRWYFQLCQLFEVKGKSFLFYKTNDKKSYHKDELTARKGLVEGLSSNGKICFVYHCYNHYFCPVGYEFIANKQNMENIFNSQELLNKENDLNVLVADSSCKYPTIHTFNWNLIQLDLRTYFPKKFNIRNADQGVEYIKGEENSKSEKKNRYCIMAFEKID